MARAHELLFALNAGGVDKEALARVDLEKLRLAGEHPVSNWFPRVLGPMMLRPGLQSMYRLAGDAVTRPVPFERDESTSVVLAFQASDVTVFQDGVPVQVADAASAILNPTFSSALTGDFTTGWRDDSETGDGTDGTASVSGAILTLTATKYRSASVQQSVAIAGGDQATAHTVRIDVSLGPVFVRFGTSQDAENLMTEQRLMTGTHKLTVTPGAAALWIKIRSEDAEKARVVTRCQFEHTILGGTGDLFLPTPWAEADLPYLAWDQSADVLFIGDGTYQPRRIERRGEKSWSIVLYQTRGGPLVFPATDKVRLTPTTYTSNGTLTSNLPYFSQSHVGSIFELTHNEQHVIEELNGFDQTTGKITVRGLFSSTTTFDDRNFGITIDMTTGSFVGTIALERSTDINAEVWSQFETYTATLGSTTINDEQSNLIVHYRFRVTAYTSGYANVTITYLNGTTTSKIRITSFSSSTSVGYEVTEPLGGVVATATWRGPAWTDDLGWPRVPRFRDGRLHWFRGDTDYASVVDDFDNYDDSREGDSAPFVRTVGSGGSAGVRWALDMDKLAIGASSFVASVQASDLGETLTPTNFAVRRGPSVGASFVPPAQIDDRAIMADRSNTRLYDVGTQDNGTTLSAIDATRLNPSAVSAGILAMAVQRQPDTRVFVVLADGTCAVLTWERDDKVVALTEISSPGAVIEDVCVIPGESQDRVYFVVKRNSTQRYIERLAEESTARSTSTFAGLDAHKVLTGSIASITGGTQLASQQVAVFADGQYRGLFTLNSGGAVSLGATYSRVVYGLPYTASFLSVKLAYAAKLGSAIGEQKMVRRVGLILSNTVVDGMSIGKDASNTDPMPDFYKGAARTTGQLFEHWDDETFAIPGQWDSDSRIYIGAVSSYGPVTVQGIAINVDTREGLSAENGKG